jgi:hypothetical protein
MKTKNAHRNFVIKHLSDEYCTVWNSYYRKAYHREAYHKNYTNQMAALTNKTTLYANMFNETFQTLWNDVYNEAYSKYYSKKNLVRRKVENETRNKHK